FVGQQVDYHHILIKLSQAGDNLKISVPLEELGQLGFVEILILVGVEGLKILLSEADLRSGQFFVLVLVELAKQALSGCVEWLARLNVDDARLRRRGRRRSWGRSDSAILPRGRDLVSRYQVILILVEAAENFSRLASAGLGELAFLFGAQL